MYWTPRSRTSPTSATTCMGEVRYSSLAKLFPDKAEEMFEKTRRDAMERYEFYKRLSQGCESNDEVKQ